MPARPKAPELKTGHPTRAVVDIEVFEPVDVPVPVWLVDHGAVELWNMVWSECKWVAVTDRFAVESLCELVQLKNDVLGVLEGSLAEGFEKSSLAPTVQKCQTEIRQLMGSLGLTPESRIRLGVKVAEHVSKLDEFMSEVS